VNFFAAQVIVVFDIGNKFIKEKNYLLGRQILHKMGRAAGLTIALA